MSSEMCSDITALAKQERVNILIVDDEAKNLTVLEAVLDDPAYCLVRARSGDEALLALMAHEFAVLVLDVRMPGMTGFELAQMVKERKRTARIPIIFLTAYYNEDQHILEGYGSGAVDYLHKPVNPAVLRSKVAVFAELHQNRRAMEASNRALLAEVSERRQAQTQLSELNESLDRLITERTGELQRSQLRLLEADRRKDEFLATLAHELRNPLAPVRNAVYVLKRKGLTPELLWASELIDRQVGAMSRLIDDLMDVSRINRGRIDLRQEMVDLHAVLEDAIETTRPVVHELGHRMAVEAPAGPLLVNADRTRLAQAFVNLLNNAAKYMDRGGSIEVHVQRRADSVSVVVRDRGIGIPAERLADVFEMFSQVESALERSRGGLGIGLSLTQRLIQLHGGTVTAYSAGPGSGSEFIVELPLASGQVTAAPSKAPAPPLPAERVGTRVLVADDNRDAADTLSVLLQMKGHLVRHVADGKAAVQAVIEFDPQLLLLDIGMPGLNGYEACRQIRALPGGKARTLVAVTGWGQPEDRLRSREAGFDHHLVKPVNPSELLAFIASLALSAPAA